MPSPKQVFSQTQLKSLARAHTEMAVRTICGLAKNATGEAVKLQACALLLDRGWGKAAQPLTGEDGEGEIKIIIRNVIEEKRLALAAGQVIEHDAAEEKDQ